MIDNEKIFKDEKEEGEEGNVYASSLGTFGSETEHPINIGGHIIDDKNEESKEDLGLIMIGGASIAIMLSIIIWSIKKDQQMLKKDIDFRNYTEFDNIDDSSREKFEKITKEIIDFIEYHKRIDYELINHYSSLLRKYKNDKNIFVNIDEDGFNYKRFEKHYEDLSQRVLYDVIKNNKRDFTQIGLVTEKNVKEFLENGYYDYFNNAFQFSFRYGTPSKVAISYLNEIYKGANNIIKKINNYKPFKREYLEFELKYYFYDDDYIIENEMNELSLRTVPSEKCKVIKI